MRPIIDNNIVILYIKRVVIIGEVGAIIIDGILRLLPHFAACAVVVTEYGRLMCSWKLKYSDANWRLGIRILFFFFFFYLTFRYIN